MIKRRTLLKDESGVTAVEFALVAPPFLLLLLGIIELGLTLFTQTVLDGAARDAARLVRTGQVQQGATTVAAQLNAFQTTLCSSLRVLLSSSACAQNVYVDLETFPSFSAVRFTGTCNQNSNQAGNGNPCPFVQVNPRTIAAVQVRYNRPSLIGYVGRYLAGMSEMTTLSSTVIFQSEPFQ